jgi:phage-related protein
MAPDDKEIRWLGSSYADLLAFPRQPRREAGFQLGRVQADLDPTDWKPFDEVALARAKCGSAMPRASSA